MLKREFPNIQQSGEMPSICAFLPELRTQTFKYTKGQSHFKIHFMILLYNFKNYGSSPFELHTLLFLVERNSAVNHCSLLLRKYVLQLSLVTPIICNVGSLALNQFKELQKLNTYIIIMMTEKAMNVLQLHLPSLLRKKKLIICSCQP